MPTLSTPTVNDRLLARGRTPGEDRFWAHFGAQPTGQTLIKESGVWSAVSFPLQSRLEAADLITDSTGQRVRGYFLGGHIHTITSAIATELTAAGFGSYIT